MSGTQSLLKIKVEKLVYGGAGFSRLPGGKVVFLPGLYPNELALVHVHDTKKDFAEATCETLLEPSAHRCLAFCEVFGTCGGCTWQTLTYPQQLVEKENIVKDIWQRAKIASHMNHLHVHASPVQEGYRHRVQLHYKNGQLGFLQKNSHTMIPIADCPILSTGIRKFLSDKNRDTHQLHNIPERFHIFSNKNGDVFIENSDEEASIDVMGKNFIFSPAHFFQSHITLIQEMISLLINEKLRNIPTHDCAADLYAGVGLFSAFLEEHFDKVLACEENTSVEPFLKKNAPKTLFSAMSVEKFLQKKLPKMDCVILDPPRKGLSHKVTQLLCEKNIAKLIYISCDPVTQARDLALLTQNYTIDDVHLFDFYPHTSHIEMLVELNKK